MYFGSMYSIHSVFCTFEDRARENEQVYLFVERLCVRFVGVPDMRSWGQLTCLVTGREGKKKKS
jgi:hypothetical protein